jgi:hypothetical protein
MIVDIPKLIQVEYAERLLKHGIPADPAQRMPDQANTASMMFWAVQNSFLLSASGLTQAGLELK